MRKESTPNYILLTKELHCVPAYLQPLADNYKYKIEYVLRFILLFYLFIILKKPKQIKFKNSDHFETFLCEYFFSGVVDMCMISSVRQFICELYLQ